MITYHPSFVVRWWVLVHCGQNFNKPYLSQILILQKVCENFKDFVFLLEDFLRILLLYGEIFEFP
jgi:hypothetical protein